MNSVAGDLQILREKGAEIAYSDPHVPALAASLLNAPHALRSLALDADVLRESDCAVILTDHGAFDYELIVAHSDLLVDARNALGSRSAPGVVRLGAPLPPHNRLLDEDVQRRVA